MYPNPAHGVLTVDLSEVNDAVAELTLGDLGGREVAEDEGGTAADEGGRGHVTCGTIPAAGGIDH